MEKYREFHELRILIFSIILNMQQSKTIHTNHLYIMKFYSK